MKLEVRHRAFDTNFVISNSSDSHPRTGDKHSD